MEMPNLTTRFGYNFLSLAIAIQAPGTIVNAGSLSVSAGQTLSQRVEINEGDDSTVKWRRSRTFRGLT